MPAQGSAAWSPGITLTPSQSLYPWAHLLGKGHARWKMGLGWGYQLFPRSGLPTIHASCSRDLKPSILLAFVLAASFCQEFCPQLSAWLAHYHPSDFSSNVTSLLTSSAKEPLPMTPCIIMLFAFLLACAVPCGQPGHMALYWSPCSLPISPLEWKFHKKTGSCSLMSSGTS